MKILIVKISSMGDIVHAMPIVADILHAFPHATIDWLAEESFSSLVQQVRGVRTVISVALRRWRQHLFSKKTWKEILLFYQQLRAEKYDWIIDAQGLIKSAMLSAMARGPVSGLANRTEGAGYEWPVRFFYRKRIYISPRTHVVTRSRLLVAETLQYSLPERIYFGLVPPSIDLSDLDSQSYIVFVHGSSRVDKTWSLILWKELGEYLISLGYRIALPWGTSAEHQTSVQLATLLGAHAWVPPHLPLSKITGLLAAATATIGVDTGLSHIAAALSKPTIQIYRFDTAWRTGSLGSDQIIGLGRANHTVTVSEIKTALTTLGIV